MSVRASERSLDVGEEDWEVGVHDRPHRPHGLSYLTQNTKRKKENVCKFEHSYKKLLHLIVFLPY